MMFLPKDDPRHKVWDQCESPIEQHLCCALFILLGCKAVEGPFDYSRLPQLAELAGDAPACFLFAQHSIGRYRADFLLVAVDPHSRRHRRIVIECDGKHYHGGEEQIARDERRDSEIHESGYRVVRYSGADIHGDMREVIAGIKLWVQASGIVCEPAYGASLLLAFTPSRSDQKARKEARASCGQDDEDEEQSEKPDFVTESGNPCWWRDTL